MRASLLRVHVFQITQAATLYRKLLMTDELPGILGDAGEFLEGGSMHSPLGMAQP